MMATIKEAKEKRETKAMAKEEKVRMKGVTGQRQITTIICTPIKTQRDIRSLSVKTNHAMGAHLMALILPKNVDGAIGNSTCLPFLQKWHSPSLEMGQGIPPGRGKATPMTIKNGKERYKSLSCYQKRTLRHIMITW